MSIKDTWHDDESARGSEISREATAFTCQTLVTRPVLGTTSEKITLPIPSIMIKESVRHWSSAESHRGDLCWFQA